MEYSFHLLELVLKTKSRVKDKSGNIIMELLNLSISMS